MVRGIAAFRIRASVWEVPDVFSRIRCRLGSMLFSADDIEHGVLRGNRPAPLSGEAPFRAGDPRLAYALTPPDPRTHFAINCGGRSCPLLRVYDGPALDRQLEAATRTYVNQQVVLDGETLSLSPIFGWFRADFDELPGGLSGFLTRYLDAGPARRHILARGIGRTAWRDWDWRLPVQMAPGQRGSGQWTARA